MKRMYGKSNKGGPTQVPGGPEGGPLGPTGGAPGTCRAPADPLVAVTRKRRNLTVAFKKHVIEKVAALRSNGFGAIGSFLRSVGVYYSSVKRWERQEKAGVLTSSSEHKVRSPKVLQQEVKRLRRQLDATQQKLRQSEIIIDLQKKISDLAASSLPQNCERNK